MKCRDHSAVWLFSVALFCFACVGRSQYLMPGGRQGSQGAGRPVDAVTFKREMAHLYADMRLVQEDMRMLVNRISALEQENAAKEALIRELQERLAGYERRFQQLDLDVRSSEERALGEVSRSEDKVLRSANASAQKGIDGLKNLVLRELSRIEGIAVRAANTASRQVPQAVPVGEWKEFRVQAGDTLIGIASQAGVSVRTLRQCNGLKSDVIRVGQILKVPVTQK